MRHRHFKTSNTFPNYASHNYKSVRSVRGIRTCDTEIAGTYIGLYVRKYKVYIYPVGAVAAEMATASYS